jgi:hypothetical protein
MRLRRTLVTKGRLQERVCQERGSRWIQTKKALQLHLWKVAVGLEWVVSLLDRVCMGRGSFVANTLDGMIAIWFAFDSFIDGQGDRWGRTITFGRCRPL